MASVQFRGVTKSFGGTHILRGINTMIADGSFAVLVGPSGCGKSTLLRLLAGLEVPTDGTIMIDGQDVSRTAPQQRDIAMVFQSYALYPHMDVARNMGFALTLRGTPQAEIDRRVKAAAARLSLDHLLDRLPRQLSGGQRQRVAMGRAIVRDPKVFLFDEPLSNLDAKLRVQMRSEIRALQQSLGSTCLYVTHDQIEAMTMADVILVLNQGRIAQSGPPQTLYDDPDNRFVAEFIGSPSMNFLAGQITGAVWRAETGHSLPLSGISPGDEGRPVLLGIRPEHVMLSDGPGTLPLTVRTVENTGAEVHIRGFCGNGTITLVARPPATTRPGVETPIRLDPAHCLFFDAGTEERLRTLRAVPA